MDISQAHAMTSSLVDTQIRGTEVSGINLHHSCPCSLLIENLTKQKRTSCDCKGCVVISYILSITQPRLFTVELCLAFLLCSQRVGFRGEGGLFSPFQYNSMCEVGGYESMLTIVSNLLKDSK